MLVYILIGFKHYGRVRSYIENKFVYAKRICLLTTRHIGGYPLGILNHLLYVLNPRSDLNLKTGFCIGK